MVETKVYPLRSIDGKIVEGMGISKILIVYKDNLKLIPFQEIEQDGIKKIKMI